jgi:hypothetical protein
MPQILRESAAGVVVDDHSDAGLFRAAELLFEKSQHPGVSQAARELAERWFSLERGLEAYDYVYRSLSEKASNAGQDRGWPPP